MFHFIILSEKEDPALETDLNELNDNNNLIFLDKKDFDLKNIILKLFQIRLYYTYCINDNIFILLDEKNEEIEYLTTYVFTLLNIKTVILDGDHLETIVQETQLDSVTNRLYTRSYCNDCDSNYYTLFKNILLLSNESECSEAVETAVKKSLLSITLDDIIIKDNSFDRLRLLNKRSLDNIVDDWVFNCNIYNKLQLIQLGIHILTKVSGGNSQYATTLVLLGEIFYHQDNKFHNFYHAIDVLQAAYFLSSSWKNLDEGAKNKNTRMTLLISALLHDSAHTGSNNNLLLQNKELTAKLNTQQSVLEKIHFKVLSHIIKNLIIFPGEEQTITQNFQFGVSEKLILATDMQRHAEFIKRLKQYGDQSEDTIDEETDPSLLKYKLIIKAADISNVTRPLEISAQWGVRISQEFKSYGFLTAESKNEKVLCDILKNGDDRVFNGLRLNELSVKDCISFEPGVCKSQIFFIDVFAREFFQLLKKKFISENAALKQLLANLEDNYLFWKNNVDGDEKSSN